METLAGFVILAPQAVGAAQVEEHHGPGRVDGTGVALRGPLPRGFHCFIFTFV